MNVGITCYLRNLKFGIFKNRYKKWLMLKSEINTIMNDNNSVCNLLLELELQLKNIKQNVNERKELEEVLNISIENLITEMKNNIATYQAGNGDVITVLKNIEDIEKYEIEMKNVIKSYQLNNNYLDYKKANGIIDNKEEEEKYRIENKMIRDFKAIL